MASESEAPAASKTYTGSCHCGANKFSTKVSPPLEADGATVLSCNCSICGRNGYLFAFVQEKETTWVAGGLDAMTKYQFGKKKLGHWFCPTCGTSLVSAYVEPDSPYAGMIGLNARAFDDVDVAKLKLNNYDGKSV